MRTKKRVSIVTRHIVDNPLLMLVMFLGLLLLRNWQQLLLVDIYDGLGARTSLVHFGSSPAGFRHYFNTFVMQPYDQHFTPVWFLLFWVLVWGFDSNPWVLGLLSFGFGACLLYLLFRLTRRFVGATKHPVLYSLLVSLLFSSTLFFLETITWKWQLALLIASVSYVFCLVIVAEEKFSKPWLALYSLSALVSVWTFGISWIGLWLLALYLLLAGYGRKHRVLWLTVGLALVTSASEVLTNQNSIPALNLHFLVVTLPGFIGMETTNIVLSLVGVFRFTAMTQIKVTGIMTVVALGAVAVFYARRYRTKRWDKTDAMVVTLLVSYLLLLTLGLVRIMPASGTQPTVSLDNYVFGNRYMFAFGLPLFLTLVIGFGKQLANLSRYTLTFLIFGALLLGFGVQHSYPAFDPPMNDRSRNVFYNLEPTALQSASQQKLALPDISGDAFFKGAPTPISQVIYFRTVATDYTVRFVKPTSLSATQCQAVHRNSVVTHWLNSYNTAWCLTPEASR